MTHWLTLWALVLSLALIGWAAAARALCGSWLHPAALFALWWCFAGILPLLFSPSDPVSPGAVAWVIVATLAVGAGAVIGNGGFKTRLRPYSVEPTRIERQLLSAVVIIATVLGILSSVFFALSSGVALADMLDIQKLVVISNRLYIARYAELDPAAAAPPRLSQALLPFVYIAPAVGGVLFVIHRKWLWKLAAIGTLLPAIAVTTLQTTKAAVLFSLILWVASYLASRLRLGKIGLFTRAHTLVALLIGSIATAFFVAVSLARLASTDTALLETVRVKLVTAAFGHMTVFSQWLDEYWRASLNPTLGEYTFAGPRDILGIHSRIPGVFGTIVNLAIGETSNIFTGFRPLIQDFTMPGALVILGILGFAGGVAYRNVAAGGWANVPVLVAVYVTIFWTPITWFWIYNSLTAAIFAFCLLVWFVRILPKSRGLRSRWIRRHRKYAERLENSNS